MGHHHHHQHHGADGVDERDFPARLCLRLGEYDEDVSNSSAVAASPSSCRHPDPILDSLSSNVDHLDGMSDYQ